MDVQALLDASAARHDHLCPRQVLGVRAGLAGITALKLPFPVPNKRLLVILETDGCFADGVEVSSGVSVGHRTLRIEDYGKSAATFIDLHTSVALRITPRLDIRQRAWSYAPQEVRHYQAMLRAYEIMPEEELFSFLNVNLLTPIAAIVSKPGIRVDCEHCGEEIINERQVVRDGMILCRSCAGLSYYQAPAPGTVPFRVVHSSADH